MISRPFIPILVLIYVGWPWPGFAQEPQVSSSALKSQYLAKEKEAAELARQIRSAPMDGEQLKAALRRSVADAFALRQQLHHAELADFQKRMAKVQQTIQTREEMRDKIIERRVNDLLNPDTPWDTSPVSESDSHGGEANSVPFSKSLSRSEPGGSDGARSLLDAIGEFNRKYASHPIGKRQPPLTDEEVIASIRWATLDRGKSTRSAGHLETLRQIAEQRYLPLHWNLDASTLEVNGLRAWSVRLNFPNEAAETSSDETRRQFHEIRRQFIGWAGADGQTALPPVVANPVPDPKGMPLAAAIHGFNAQHKSFAGQEQPPLTETEVVAAILAAQADRNQYSVSNAEFEAFQAVAARRSLPAGAKLELIPSFSGCDGYNFSIWSVRIVMARTEMPGFTYAFQIRERFIRSEPVENENISWGKPAENGLQAGIMFEPSNEQYAFGQAINPRFYFRNSGARKLTVLFPRVMTRSYYKRLHTTDAASNDLVTETDPAPGGPVGWIEMTLEPDEIHRISGMPITLAASSRDPRFESAIYAKAGTQCRVSYTVSNYADPKAAHLETGKINFTVSEPPAGATDSYLKAAPGAEERVQLRFLVFGTSRNNFRRLVKLPDPEDMATDHATYSPIADFDELLKELQVKMELQVLAVPVVSTFLGQKSTSHTIHFGRVPDMLRMSSLKNRNMDLFIDCSTARSVPHRGPVVDLNVRVSLAGAESDQDVGENSRAKFDRKISAKLDLTPPNDRMIFAPFSGDGKDSSIYVLIQEVTAEPKPPVANSIPPDNPLAVPPAPKSGKN